MSEQKSAISGLAGLSLADAFRRAVLESEDVQKLVDDGRDVPAGELIFLDLARERCVPRFRWSYRTSLIHDEGEAHDFGLPNPYRIARQEAHLNIPSMIWSDIPFYDGDYPTKDRPFFHDPHGEYRDHFRREFGRVFGEFIELMVTSEIKARGRFCRVGNDFSLIDGAYWRGSGCSVSFGFNQIYYLNDIEIDMISVESSDCDTALVSKSRAGRKDEYDWERCEILLADVLVETSKLTVGTDVLNRLEGKIRSEGGLSHRMSSGNGRSTPQKKAIDEAMARRFGNLWTKLRGKMD